jgi:hypothetical protein
MLRSQMLAAAGGCAHIHIPQVGVSGLSLGRANAEEVNLAEFVGPLTAAWLDSKTFSIPQPG